MDLRLLATPVRPDRLPDILAGRDSTPESKISAFEAHLEPVIEHANGAIDDDRITGLEGELAPMLNDALRHIPRRLAVDPALWNWLAIDPFQRFVLHRWFKGEKPQPGSAVSAQSMIRWSLKPTMRGFANHAIARLYWSAEHLGRDNDHALTRAALSKQDLFKNVFERELCLHPPAARACISRYAGGTEEEWRCGIKDLNLVLSTTSVEYLEEPEIAEILRLIDSGCE